MGGVQFIVVDNVVGGAARALEKLFNVAGSKLRLAVLVIVKGDAGVGVCVHVR